MEPQGTAPDHRTGPYFTVGEAAAYARCSKRKIEAAVATGGLWSFKSAAGRRLTNRAAVDAWLLPSNTTEAAA